MSQEMPEDHISRKTVVLRLPGMDEVEVRRDLDYPAEETALPFDLYTPWPRRASLLPLVLSVAGYPDPGMERVFGVRTKEMGSSRSWARLIAASGMAAVTYANREPARDIHALLRHLRNTGPALGLDPNRIGLIATSGHAPLAVSTLIDDRGGVRLCGAALICPLLLDLDGSTAIADMAKTYRFANPGAGRTVADLPKETAFFIARAGRDEMPGLNQALDRFVAHALAANLPLSLFNLPEAPHAFDLLHDREISRAAIRAALAFLSFELQAP